MQFPNGFIGAFLLPAMEPLSNAPFVYCFDGCPPTSQDNCMSWEGTYPAWLSRQQPTMEQLQRHRDAYMSKKTAEFWDSPEGIEVLKRRRDFERRHRQSGQRAKSTAVKARRSEKAAAALREDGFALQPLDEADDSATWRSLAQFLLTSDPAHLGTGKDVTRSFGLED